MSLRARHVFPPLIALIAVQCAAIAAARRQGTTSQPSFEVASVKPNNSAADSGRISGPAPGRFTVTNTPLRFIVLYAYQLLDHQLIAAPEWTFSSSFDISATYPPGNVPTDQDVRLMLQSLLASRFSFVGRRETRQLPAYALVMARRDGSLGPQLVRSNVDCEKVLAEQRPQTRAGGTAEGAPGGARPVCRMVVSRRFLTAGTRTIQNLSVSLQSLVGRPVVDRTGLSGTFDMGLQWTSGVVAPAAGGTAAPPDDGPSLFTALQEQLGLKLESTRAPFEVLVIDSVQRPMPD
jgi:uncharacterized protein (TIGR03435 family)